MGSLKNFPFILIFVAYAGYLGFQFYEFNYAPDGQVEMHKAKIKQKLSRTKLGPLPLVGSFSFYKLLKE